MADGGTGHSVELALECATVSLVDLRRMMGCNERTVRRNLRKRGIPAGGRRITLAELQMHWPLLFNSFLITKEPKFRCPRCDAPTKRSCTSCDFCRA